MYSVCLVEHVVECSIIVLHVLEKPLLKELRVGQGLCVGVDVSLHELVGVGLITCEEAVVVKGVHTLLSGGHRLATALKEVEKVQEEVPEIKEEQEDEEVERNGGKFEEKRSSHEWMR